MADTDHTGARRALNGWATHPLLELLSKVSAPLATATIAAGVFAMFHMGAELTELRTLYGALDEEVCAVPGSGTPTCAGRRSSTATCATPCSTALTWTPPTSSTAAARA